MGLNLLGKKDNGNEGYKPEPEFYIPPDEPKEKKPSRREVLKRKNIEEKVSGQNQIEQDLGVDLAESILRKRRRIRLIIIFVILLLAIGASGGVYYFLSQNKPIKAPSVPSPIVEPAGTPVVNVEPEPTVTAQPIQPSQPEILPDTPLAPIRGSLIKFNGSNDVYLVEQNGELRLVNQSTVIFDNGQSFSQINENLIYTILDKWKDTRKGSQNVTGRVDFDPRVLSLSELLPFIR